MQSSPNPKTTITVFMVDDEEDNHQFAEWLLQEQFENVELTRCLHRTEAFLLLSQTEPDLLITDLRSDNVPGRGMSFGISGFELLKLLAAQKVAYPILVASGSLAVPVYEALAKECAGPDLKVRYLQKPYSPEQFWEAVESLMHETHECKRIPIVKVQPKISLPPRVPKDWLTEEISLEEAEKDIFKTSWHKVVSCDPQSYRIWKYSSPSFMSYAFYGRAGLALVKDDQVIDSFATVMN